MQGILRWLALAGAALGLAACGGAPPHTLSADEVGSLRISEIAVSAAPDAAIAWPEGQARYLQAKGLDPNDPANGAAINTPDGREWMRNELSGMVKAALQKDAAPNFTGQRPTRMVATIRSMNIPTVVQRVIVGGAPTMQIDIVLIDAANGRQIATYAGATSSAVAGQGLYTSVADAVLSQALTGTTDHAPRVIGSVVSGFNAWIKQPRQ